MGTGLAAFPDALDQAGYIKKKIWLDKCNKERNGFYLPFNFSWDVVYYLKKKKRKKEGKNKTINVAFLLPCRL